MIYFNQKVQLNAKTGVRKKSYSARYPAHCNGLFSLGFNIFLLFFHFRGHPFLCPCLFMGGWVCFSGQVAAHLENQSMYTLKLWFECCKLHFSLPRQRSRVWNRSRLCVCVCVCVSVFFSAISRLNRLCYVPKFWL